MRIIVILLTLLVAKASFAQTVFETSLSTPNFAIGNGVNEKKARGNSIQLEINSDLQNNFYAHGYYGTTNASINDELLKSTTARGGIGYLLANDLSIWTGAGRKTSVFLSYSGLSIDGGGYSLNDNQLDVGFSAKYSVAPKFFTDVKISGSLNDPEKSYDAHLKIGYLFRLGELKFGLAEHRTVINGTDSSMNYYTLGFAISR